MSLCEMQKDFGAAVTGQAVTAAHWLASPDADERIDVYRGTVRGVLVKALSLNYPAVQRLVGTDFFDWAAALYAIDHQPLAANLNDYGGSFPEFLQALPACSGIEYLPEVARIDWAVAKAIHAEDLEPLAPADLGVAIERADAAVFVAHPSVSLLECRFPADKIWSAVLDGEPGALERIDVANGPCWLLVERRGLRPQVSRMSQPEWTFAQDFFMGKRLADALLRVHSDGSAPGWLAQHLATGRIVGWRLTENEENR